MSLFFKMLCVRSSESVSFRSMYIHSVIRQLPSTSVCFFFNDPAPTEIYPLSLHDALPILAVLLGEGQALGLLAADRALQLRRGLGPNVRLEPLEHGAAEPAPAVLRRDAHVRAPAILPAAEDAAVGHARLGDDGAGRVFRDQHEAVRLRVRRLETAREVDRLRPAGSRVAILELDAPFEVGRGGLANGKSGDHAASLVAVYRVRALAKSKNARSEPSTRSRPRVDSRAPSEKSSAVSKPSVRSPNPTASATTAVSSAPDRSGGRK